MDWLYVLEERIKMVPMGGSMSAISIILASILWSLKERSKYLFSLGLSLGGSIISALTFYLNASFRNQTTVYGVDFITYMSASVLISAVLMRWSTPPSSYKISLLGDPVYIVLGQMVFSTMYQISLAIPSLIILMYLGAKPMVGVNSLLFVLVILTSVSMSTFLTISESLIPGSNIVLAAYNSLNLISSGMWFVPTALGRFFPLVYLTPQFWIGEGVRYSLLRSSLVDLTVLVVVLSALMISSLLLSQKLVVHAGRRGGFR